jgi:hypothetical protein
MKRHLDKPSAILGTALLFALMPGAAALAHNHSAYSHDSGISHENADWMANVADQRRLADMSLPGTHDTMTYALNDDDYQWSVGVDTDVAYWISVAGARPTTTSTSTTAPSTRVSISTTSCST